MILRATVSEVVVAGDVHDGDPAAGAIVQYVGERSDPIRVLVVLRFAMLPGLYSLNQTAFRAESNATPTGLVEVVGINDSSYIEPPPVSFPRIEILLLFGLLKKATGKPLINPAVISVG